MLAYYDRQGRRLPGLETWADLIEDPAYGVLGDYRDRGWRVSTRWFGIPLGLHAIFAPEAPPFIFETMIFPPAPADEPGWWYQERYVTEAAALAGHDRARAALAARLGPPVSAAGA
jgi:hypothetical protein